MNDKSLNVSIRRSCLEQDLQIRFNDLMFTAHMYQVAIERNDDIHGETVSLLKRRYERKIKEWEDTLLKVEEEYSE